MIKRKNAIYVLIMAQAFSLFAVYSTGEASPPRPSFPNAHKTFMVTAQYNCKEYAKVNINTGPARVVEVNTWIYSYRNNGQVYETEFFKNSPRKKREKGWVKYGEKERWHIKVIYKTEAGDKQAYAHSTGRKPQHLSFECVNNKPKVVVTF